MPDQRPPSGLRASGKRLWLSVVDKYVLTAAEVEMLGQAARTADELDRLERAVRALPELTTVGAQARYGRIRCSVRFVPIVCCWSASRRL